MGAVVIEDVERAIFLLPYEAILIRTTLVRKIRNTPERAKVGFGYRKPNPFPPRGAMFTSIAVRSRRRLHLENKSTLLETIRHKDAAIF